MRKTNFFRKAGIAERIAIVQSCAFYRPQRNEGMLDEYGDVLTIADLQDILSIGRNTAYSMIQNGIIPAVRVGRKKWRISKQAVIRYLNQEK